MSYPNKRDCKHGSMRGKCDLCEYEHDISELERRILELEKENNKLKMPIELGERRVVTKEQLNKIKADAVREAMKNISNSLDWDWSHVSSYEYCELLKEYADKLERGDV